MIEITRHTKTPPRLSKSFSRGGSAKQVCILATARPLSPGPVATTAGFASPWQRSPVQAKVSQKSWWWPPHVLHSALPLRKPGRGGTSRSLQKSRRGQRRSSPPWPETRGTTCSWRQATLPQPLFHAFVRWHAQVVFLKAGHNTDDRRNWKLCSFPVAPSRV